MQKQVAVLERAELITKQQPGHERIVQGRIDTVRDVNHLLGQLEASWRARIQRFGDVLAEPDQGDQQ